MTSQSELKSRNVIRDFVVCIVAAFTVYIALNSPNYSEGAITCRHISPRYQCVVLAESLVKDYSGNGKCLIIHHPVRSSEVQELEEYEKYFKEGMGGKVKEIKFVPIKDVDMDSDIIPEEILMDNTAEDFNRVLRANKDCDLVIVMVSLPFSEDEFYKMDIFKMIEEPEGSGDWTKDPSIFYPRLGIHNGFVGNFESLFKEGLIHSMSLWRPNPDLKNSHKPLKFDSVQEAFKQKYILLQKDNIDSIKSGYPKLFPKKR